MRRWTAALALTATIGAGAAAAGCSDKPASCPDPPAPPPVTGVRTVRAERTNVNLELGYRYMRALIREQFEGAPDPAATSGARVTSVSLTQEGDGAAPRNLVTVGLTPWLGSSPRADLPRQFRLVLEIRPHLVTAAVQPDEQLRRQWLGGADEGVALTFAFVRLRDVSMDREVGCPTSGAADPVADQVLRGVYDGLRGQQPVVVPVELVTGLATALTGGTAAVTGVNLATAGDLKLGFTLDSGSPAVFSPETLLIHHPADDWGFELDRSLVSRLVAAKAGAVVRGQDPFATIDAVDVDFSAQGLFVTVKATHKQNDPCPDIHVTATSLTKVSVRRDPAGPSVLVGRPGEPTLTDDSNLAAKICFAVDKALFGQATAVIGPARAGPSCPDTLGPPLSFDFGTDTFSGASVDTDETFFISGRSRHVDEVLAGATPAQTRPPVPVC
ncbi:hypothetical protein GCM10020358_60090 [Amorphoplanes nipponensis]|uniref:Uncharacterized protein n=1 Tax=Actinoplanes nipponensis TaxID=135950 RepID=A0A919MJZ7_9ACTN|nr:hypothetical protein [Actinoplanes nipponensis]GIE47182.1 hypothetical protein Ani05nite_07160 [Actinoplanes nipponensis]